MVVLFYLFFLVFIQLFALIYEVLLSISNNGDHLILIITSMLVGRINCHCQSVLVVFLHFPLRIIKRQKKKKKKSVLIQYYSV